MNFDRTANDSIRNLAELSLHALHEGRRGRSARFKIYVSKEKADAVAGIAAQLRKL